MWSDVRLTQRPIRTSTGIHFTTLVSLILSLHRAYSQIRWAKNWTTILFTKKCLVETVTELQRMSQQENVLPCHMTGDFIAGYHARQVIMVRPRMSS